MMVRWRPHGRHCWRYGRVAGTGSDGSLLVYDTDGAARNLRPENVEYQVRGPRGGKHWEPVQPGSRQLT